MASGTSRRGFLTSAIAASGAAVAATTSARAAEGDPAITELQPWNQLLGDGEAFSATPTEGETFVLQWDADSGLSTTDAAVRQELVFVDGSVDNYQQLLDDLLGSTDTTRSIDVHVLEILAVIALVTIMSLLLAMLLTRFVELPAQRWMRARLLRA